MKKNILFASLLAALSFGFVSCSDDDLSSESVIVADKVEKTPLDSWIDKNLTAPFNINIKYRYEYNETDNSYYTVPARYDDAVTMAHILKYCCIDTYVDVAGLEFTRTYFPKLFYFEGEFHYRNNDSFELGTAEGGRKIFLMGMNYLSEYMNSRDALNHYYLHTIHHEFTHILHQTVEFSTAYQLITSDYKSDKCFNKEFADFLSRGFITDYAQKNYHEDFAEMVSTYVTSTADEWEALMKKAEYGVLKDKNGDFVVDSEGSVKIDTKVKADGRDLIEQKLSIVRSYMQDQWGIDIDVLRASILQRENDVVNGKIDLKNLD